MGSAGGLAEVMLPVADGGGDMEGGGKVVRRSTRDHQRWVDTHQQGIQDMIHNRIEFFSVTAMARGNALHLAGPHCSRQCFLAGTMHAAGCGLMGAADCGMHCAAVHLRARWMTAILTCSSRACQPSQRIHFSILVNSFYP